MSRASARETVQRFHERHPGTSSALFSRIVDQHGRSAYELVASAAMTGQHDADVLDLGCGDGMLLESIARRDTHARLFGVDFSPSELQLARERVPQASLQLADLHEALPFEVQTFDVVTSHMVLMLLGNLDALFTSVARVLRPGGRFVFVVDALQLVPNRYADALRYAMSDVGLLQPTTRFDTAADARLYDPALMRDALASHGLQLRTREQFTLVAPADEAFTIDVVLGSYPLGVVDDATRERAAEATRAWYARERRAIDVPLQLYIAERER